MLLFIAPYGGEAPEKTPFLAASKKMNFLLSVLASRGDRVVLLNTFRRDMNVKIIEYSRKNLDDGTVVDVMTLGAIHNIGYSYLMNLLRVPMIANSLVRRYDIPEAVWCYNGYALESKIGGYLKRYYGSRIILEFEDWHFARGRGLNPKPMIDWVYWKLNIRHIDYGFAVNEMLKTKLEINHVSTDILPGVLSDWVLDMARNSPPFTNNNIITVGYFGGLSKEKGAELIIGLIDNVRRSMLPIRFIVTGSGELENYFRSYSIIYPDILNFLGSVDERTLENAYSITDVIINPHEINDGVFPFKVIEGVGSGRLMISTLLSLKEGCDLDWLKDAVVTCKKDIDAFTASLMRSRYHYNERKSKIDTAVDISRRLYSRQGMEDKIFNVLHSLGLK
jgi:glycosyltransferase involved in cell wall biosynthesis